MFLDIDAAMFVFSNAFLIVWHPQYNWQQGNLQGVPKERAPWDWIK